MSIVAENMNCQQASVVLAVLEQMLELEMAAGTIMARGLEMVRSAGEVVGIAVGERTFCAQANSVLTA